MRLHKSLVLGAGVLAPAMAWAQPSLTVGGMLDIAPSWVSYGSAARGGALRIESGVGAVNSLHVRGSEDLGAGMSAFYMFDMGFGLDTGATRGNHDPGAPAGFAGFGRRSVLGMSLWWGSFTLGRDYHPAYRALGIGDPLELRFWGNAQGFALGQSARFNNGLFYASPAIRGLTMRAAIGRGTENDLPGLTRTGQGRSLGFEYASAGLALAFGWLQENTGPAPYAAAAAASAVSEIGTWVAGGSYDFGVAKAFLGASDVKGGGAAAWYHRSATWIGAQLPFGRNTLHGVVASTHSRPGSATTVGLAYEMRLSRRTALYASYGRVDNDATSNVALLAASVANGPVGPPAAGTATTPGLDAGLSPQAVSFGIRHRY